MALAYSLEKHPDLASLSRELAAIVHRNVQKLADGLADLRKHNRGFGRWLLARHGHPRVSVLVMAWPPGYSTPSHDHTGLWGLDLSLHGAFEIESWTRTSNAEPWRKRGRAWLGPGDANWFDADPPYMYRCRNLSRQETALSLHVYSGDLQAHATYEPIPAAPDELNLPPRTRLAGSFRL